MRTTLNIEDETLQQLRDEAEKRNLPLTTVVNQVLELGLKRLRPSPGEPPYTCPTFSMGFPPGENLDKALALASLLEDEETVRKLKPPR